MFTKSGKFYSYTSFSPSHTILFMRQIIRFPVKRFGFLRCAFLSFEDEVVRLVNQERAKHDLAALQSDWELARVARYKSEDMRDLRYFNHTSPTYGSPHDMIRNFGISYRASGENIAAGQTSAQAVFNAWMNSSGHRQNILSANYTHIGVGYAKGGSYGHYWTQMFIGR